MRQRHSHKPGLLSGGSSRSLGYLEVFVARRAGPLAVLALLTLTLDGLGSGLVLVDLAAFERLARGMDSSMVVSAFQVLVAWGPALFMLLVDLKTLSRRPGMLRNQARASRVLDALAIVYAFSNVAILRSPWLLGYACAGSRLDVWSARLSSMVVGVPLVAFLLAVGHSLLMVATSLAALRALAYVGHLENPPSKRHIERGAWALCAVNVLVGTLTIVSLATGGFK